MRARRSRRVRRTAEEWAEIFRRFDSKNLGARQFCRQEGLPLSSFHRWRPRVKARTVAEFVDLSPPATGAVTPWELEVALPNGVRLQFRG